MPQALNHNSNAYIAVTLAPGSSYLSVPAGLTVSHPSLAYQGPVGALPDVQLYSIPKPDWEHIHEEVLSTVRSREGVVRVDIVQEARQRSKRDEL